MSNTEYKRSKVWFRGAVCEVCRKEACKNSHAMIAVEEINEFRGDDVTHVRHEKCHRKEQLRTSLGEKQ